VPVSTTSGVVMFLQWCVAFAAVGTVMSFFLWLAKRAFGPRPNEVYVMTASWASASVFTLVLALI